MIRGLFHSRREFLWWVDCAREGRFEVRSDSSDDGRKRSLAVIETNNLYCLHKGRGIWRVVRIEEMVLLGSLIDVVLRKKDELAERYE